MYILFSYWVFILIFYKRDIIKKTITLLKRKSRYTILNIYRYLFFKKTFYKFESEFKIVKT